MNKQLISAITLVLVSTIPAMAAPALVDEQASGMLASPAAQPANKDPQVQQAIELIKAQHQRSQVQYVKPAAHTHKNMDRALILGGPEVVPM